MITKKKIAELKSLGYKHGATAARESGSSAAPDDGWDGSLINALGVSKVCRLIGTRDETTDAYERGLAAYAAGAARGARDGAKETRATARA